MSNHFVIFPASEQTAAQNYKAGCEAEWQKQPGAEGDVGYIALDRHGQWVVPYYGPPQTGPDSQELVETPELELLRAAGELQPTVEWPDPE